MTRLEMIRFALMSSVFTLCACHSSQPAAPTAASAQVAVPQKAEPLAAPAVVAPAVGATADVLPDPMFVLPGAFAERTTLADLEARFGKSNVKIVDSKGYDGEPAHSVVLFPDDPSRRAYVDFHDDKALQGLKSISISDAGSRWRGKHGVHIGMSFAELRKINGKPFYFSGFDSHHRGTVRDEWSPSLSDDDASLGKLDIEEGDHMYFGVDLGLRADAGNIPAGAYPIDEPSESSDEPRYPRLGELFEVTALDASTSLDDEWE